MNNASNRTPNLTIRRGLALMFCAIVIPVVFDRMDEAHVVPQRMKQLVQVLDVETSIEKDWWRARVRVAHTGVQPCEMDLILKWLGEDDWEVGRSQSIRAMSPGDTIIIRMSTKAVEGKKAVKHLLDYTVRQIPISP